MKDEIREILSYVRLEQLPKHVRRAMARPTARHEDYFPSVGLADAARLKKIASTLRGDHYTPAIFIHGILPRSGTNFLADALALHPDVSPYPQRLWEFPLLSVAGSAAALQREFLFMFAANKEVVGDYELLAYLSSGWLRCLQEQANGKRLLFKDPHVHNLTLFPLLFPEDKLVLCLRDGRDIAVSSRKTFSDWLRRKTVKQIALEWRFGCEAVFSLTDGDQRHRNANLVRYEDLVRDPSDTIASLLGHLGLDASRYDFEALARLPVRGSSTSQVADDQRWQPQTKTVDFKPIGRWQNWTSLQKNQFKSVAGGTLIKAGYETNLDW